MCDNLVRRYSIALNTDPIDIKHHDDKYTIVYKTHEGKAITITPTMSSSSINMKIPSKSYTLLSSYSDINNVKSNNNNTNNVKEDKLKDNNTNNVKENDNNTKDNLKNYISNKIKSNVKVENSDSDELLLSPHTTIFLRKYDPNTITNVIRYNNKKYNLIYDKFMLTLKKNIIQCNPIANNDLDSYQMVLSGYKGICVYFDIDLPKLQTLNKTYIVYSRHMKKSEFIKIKNTDCYSIDEAQIPYYPIYVICCYTKHTMEDFVYLYPYLIKNIFHNLL
jgi:hypothetical protein